MLASCCINDSALSLLQLTACSISSERRNAITTVWIAVLVFFCILVLFETGLVLLLLVAFGKLREQISKHDDLRSSREPQIGEYAPSFIATDQYGKKVKLEDFQWKRRILAFISPGCPPCADAIKTLNAALQEEQNLVVLAFGGTDLEKNRAYAVEYDAQMPFLTPEGDILEKDYRVPAKPFALVVDEMGIIRAKGGLNNQFHLQHLLTIAFEPEPVSR
jgi:peroxiredoxin